MSTKKSGTKSGIENDPLVAPGDAQEESGAEVPVAIVDEVDRIDFGDSLMISDVADLHVHLMAALNTTRVIKLSGGDIQQIDGAGMQLLAAFVKEIVKMHVAFEWNNASPVLCEAAAQLGLADMLQLDVTE